MTFDTGVVPAETLQSYKGIDFLQAMIDGKVPQPPMCGTLGFRLAEVGDGFAAFEGLPEFRHYNPIGTVHGGFAATLLDSALGCAVFSTMAHHSPRPHRRDIGRRAQGSRRQALRPRHHDLHGVSGKSITAPVGAVIISTSFGDYSPAAAERTGCSFSGPRARSTRALRR